MSKSFALFIRMAGTLIGGLSLISAVINLKYTNNIGAFDILAFALSAFSGCVVLACAWTFASLIERSLDQGDKQQEHSARLAKIEAMLNIDTPVDPQTAAGKSNQEARDLGDLGEAQVLEELGGAGLGIDEEMEVPLAHPVLHQVGDDLVEQALPLVGRVDGEAAQGGAEGRARGDGLALLVEDGAGIVQVLVQGDVHLFQKRLDFLHGPGVGFVDLGDSHGGTSVLVFSVVQSKSALLKAAV